MKMDAGRWFTISTVLLLTNAGSALADGWDPYSQASEIGSIAQTRHNLTQSYNPGARGIMAFARNDYGEVCIYCHTPHGGNKQINAPLWNRTINSGTYTTYDKPTTLMRPISQPGPNSLTCLSCHDGTIAIDSILNMPGSGLSPTGGANSETDTQNDLFLNNWQNNKAGLPAAVNNHFKLGPSPTFGYCTLCHNNPNITSSSMMDFTVFAIGEDLRDDHPVGVLFPDTFGPGIDFNEPTDTIPGKMSFFDLDGDNHADSNEVRLYDSGDGPEVECASCHDPHGVESGGPGSRFNPSFLRVNNGISLNTALPDQIAATAAVEGIVSAGGSALCLTCHAK